MNIFKESLYNIRILFNFLTNNYEKTLFLCQKMFKYPLSPKINGEKYDRIIAHIAKKIFASNNIDLNYKKIDRTIPKILILNTKIYDNGGHTEVSMRFIKAFQKEYEIDFYLTTLDRKSNQTAKMKSEIIKKLVNNYIELDININIAEKIIKIYNDIIQNGYNTIFVNIHRNDTAACAALSLIKEYTNIKIIFWNHADHFSTLGTNFADIIITRCKNGKPITPFLANKINVVQWKFLEDTNEIKNYDENIKTELKNKLNIPPNSIVTFSGGSFYKFGKDYFKLIKKILKKHENIFHIFISNAKENDITKIQKFMGNVKNRFIILKLTTNYDLYIQISDIYIDSFPQGGALMLIDLIKHSKPVIIKSNKINPVKSFESYLCNDYKYACTTTGEMLEKLNTLLYDKKTYNELSETCRELYIKKYDTEKVKNEYRELIK